LTFNAANLTVQGDSASVTVCGVTLTVEAGESSVLVALSDGGVGANPARRRSIATNASLSLAFSAPVSITTVTLRDVDMTDSGVVRLSDATATSVNVTSNTVDVSSSGSTSALELRATGGDGFAFVSIAASRRVSTSGESTTLDASGGNATTLSPSPRAALEPDVMVWAGLVWWYWIIIICGTLLCIAFIVAVVGCLVCRKGDSDDSSEEAGLWEMESTTPGSEMFSARPGDEDADPNLEFRSRRASLTPSMSAAITSGGAGFGTNNAEATMATPSMGTYRPVSTVSSPAPFVAPPESVVGSTLRLPEAPSTHSTLRESVADQYQALPTQQQAPKPPNNYVQGDVV
jgi:hypothetical protein